MGGDHIPIASPCSALPSWGGPSPGREQGQRRTWTEHSVPPCAGHLRCAELQPQPPPYPRFWGVERAPSSPGVGTGL